jgi:uncharacterized membrane protein
MLDLLLMWALVEVLGIVFLPLTVTVFHNLPDKGWAFSKGIGLAALAFCVWLPLMCLQFLPFSRLFILGVLLILVALNILGFLRVRKTLWELLRSHLAYFIFAELIFLGMVFLLGLLRSFDPSIQNFEMFMDEGFLASIMRSPHFPPSDMWFAGQPINYYYYAHYNIAVLAKLLGQPPSIAFNTGISMFFGLTAINLFGVTCNVVAWARHRRQRRLRPTRRERLLPVSSALSGAIPFGILTILLGEVLGNLAATQTWWQSHGDLSPDYWFNASRVIINTINEFPAFSFLLSCFHAHVLSLAFTIMGIGMAFNLFLELKGQGLAVFGHGWRLLLTLVMTALVLGSLYAMNGWDYPTYLALALVSIVLQQWLVHHSRLSWDLVLDTFTACASLGLLSFLLFLPFYLTFASPAQGLGLLPAVDRTPLFDEVLIYGVFAFIFLSLLLVSFFHVRPFARLSPTRLANTGPLNGLGQAQVSASSTGSLLLASASSSQPVPVGANPASVGMLDEGNVQEDGSETEAAREELAAAQASEQDAGEAFSTTGLNWRDMRVFGSLATLLVGFILLFVLKNSLTFVVTASLAAIASILALYHLKERERSFVLMLGAVACALVAFCEVVFLRDVFATTIYLRMNTVFKFYFEAWALLSIVGGVGVYFVLGSLKPVLRLPGNGSGLFSISRGLWFATLLLFLLMGAVYPLTAPYQRLNGFTQRDTSLNGLDYMSTYDPPDYAAINWINSHIVGNPVIVEAAGADYTNYGRVSVYTGLPSPMNWGGHEIQWRVEWTSDISDVVSNRENDIREIYTDQSSQDVLALMGRYNAQYLYVGPLEAATYVGVNLQRFSSFMQVVYQQDGVTIYKVR